jgi:hypothetical protein
MQVKVNFDAYNFLALDILENLGIKDPSQDQIDYFETLLKNSVITQKMRLSKKLPVKLRAQYVASIN